MSYNLYFRSCSTYKFWLRYLANKNGICMMEYEKCEAYKPIKKYGSL